MKAFANIWVRVRKSRDRNRAIDRFVWTAFCESRGRAYGTAFVCLYFVVCVFVLSFAILGFGLTLFGTRTISDLALPFVWIWKRAPESIPLIVLLAYMRSALMIYANAGLRLARAHLAKGLVTAPLLTPAVSPAAEDVTGAGLRANIDIGSSIRGTARNVASIAPATAEYLIEAIAQEWDGCSFDAGGPVDIGNAIRETSRRIKTIGLQPDEDLVECVAQQWDGCLFESNTNRRPRVCKTNNERT